MFGLMNFINLFVGVEYSPWFILVCLGIGILYAMALYFRPWSNGETQGPTYINTILFVTRFLSCSILCFFLLNPFMKYVSQRIEKPLVIVAQDNSRSVVLNKDSMFYKEAYPSSVNKMVQQLEKHYDVWQYSFGQELRDVIDFSYNDKKTDFTDLLHRISSITEDREVAALVIGSDGIYNSGINPAYGFDKLNMPIHSIAMGDTDKRKDQRVIKINNNEYVLLGNRFSIDVFIEANYLKGENSRIQIYEENEMIFEQNLLISSEEFTESISAVLKAGQPGIHKYTVKLNPLQEENYQNNSMDFFIDVLDAKQKIIILSNLIHPDVGAIKAILDQKEFVELTLSSPEEFEGSFDEYDLAIFYQLPSEKNDNIDPELFYRFQAADISGLFFLGTKTSNSSFNKLQLGLKIKDWKKTTSEYVPFINPDFSLFQVSDSMITFFADLPPVTNLFSDLEMFPGVEILLYQKIGEVLTQKPMLSFVQRENKRIGLFFGEGIWRWKLQDYRLHENHSLIEEFLNNAIKYLTITKNKRRLRIKTKKLYAEGENVIVNAALYNKTFDPVNDKDISFAIIDNQGLKYEHSMEKEGDGYKANLGKFSPGEYTYEAKVSGDLDGLGETGKFMVLQKDIEHHNLVADHNLLHRISGNNGGLVVKPDNVSSIVAELINHQTIKPKLHYLEEIKELIKFEWLLFLLIGLLGIEWAMRKLSGVY